MSDSNTKSNTPLNVIFPASSDATLYIHKSNSSDKVLVFSTISNKNLELKDIDTKTLEIIAKYMTSTADNYKTIPTYSEITSAVNTHALTRGLNNKSKDKSISVEKLLYDIYGGYDFNEQGFTRISQTQQAQELAQFFIRYPKPLCVTNTHTNSYWNIYYLGFFGCKAEHYKKNGSKYYLLGEYKFKDIGEVINFIANEA